VQEVFGLGLLIIDSGSSAKSNAWEMEVGPQIKQLRIISRVRFKTLLQFSFF